jgi:hypothetical protein
METNRSTGSTETSNWSTERRKRRGRKTASRRQGKLAMTHIRLVQIMIMRTAIITMAARTEMTMIMRVVEVTMTRIM